LGGAVRCSGLGLPRVRLGVAALGAVVCVGLLRLLAGVAPLGLCSSVSLIYFPSDARCLRGALALVVYLHGKLPEKKKSLIFSHTRTSSRFLVYIILWWKM
jgi:hypothetical protein